MKNYKIRKTTKPNFKAFLRLSGTSKRKFQKTTLIPEINPLLLTNFKNQKTTTLHWNIENKFPKTNPYTRNQPLFDKSTPSY